MRFTGSPDKWRAGSTDTSGVCYPTREFCVKLLIYSHFFAPSVGGVETVVLSLASGLAGLRLADGILQFDVTVVTQTPADEFDDRTFPFQVIRQPGTLQLWRLICQSDVVHLAGPSFMPLLLAWLVRKRVVLEHHGYQASCLNGLLLHQPDGAPCLGHFLTRNYAECLRCNARESSWVRSFATLLLMFPRRFLARHVSANLAVSQYVLNRHALPRSSVLYHGIEDCPAGENLQQDTAFLRDKISFAFVGRLVREKGIDVLLEAAHILREKGKSFEVFLIGDGPERSKLQEIITHDRLESLVRVTGFLTGPALEQALQKIRVVVMPSVWEETAGLAAIEQMMRGKLVIVSDIGGLGEIVSDSGLKFRPGDAQELAQVMCSVLEQPTLIDTLGRKARDRALRLFKRQRMVEEHARVYRSLVSGQETR
jgi:glycosyltransferase involved in cell wall biosynthesis